MGMFPYVPRTVYFDPDSDLYDPGRTRQCFAEDADINNIFAKYRRTGILGDPLEVAKKAFFDDFSDVDFEASAQKIAAVKQAFDALPSDVRTRFENDPAQLLDFIDDPANESEAVDLGLLPRSAVEGEEEEPAVRETLPATEPDGEDTT